MVASRLGGLLNKVELTGITNILDIGSWHLNQSIEFSRIFPGAKIHAFEPVPESFQLCLNKREKLNDESRTRISLHNIALSNMKGIVPFYAVDDSVEQKIDAGFSSLLKFNDGLKKSYYADSFVQKEITVQADTLDNWCADNSINHVDILWIDVQGAELLVFQGAEKTLKNTRIIMTEVGLKPYYEGHTLKADIDRYLIGLGFRELDNTFELNGFDFEANTVYVKN